MPRLVRDLQDWLLELHQLRDRALARHDATQAEELQTEIAELTAYLDEVLETAYAGVAYPVNGRGLH